MDNQPANYWEWPGEGIKLKELDDHILELYQDGILIARFSATGVTLLSITEEINKGGKNESNM